ncbi:MAG: hypothetical protein CSA36_06330 [Draconibacterium sp.]|nr:MAG: hypothetical protein CSA36_06330 [Draconibacterium sp.]
MGDSKKYHLYWKIIVVLAILLISATFSPLIIQPGKTEPRLFSMPYTLWASIVIAILLVVLTYFGGKVHLHNESKKH